jgi:hypothetical protein
LLLRPSLHGRLRLHRRLRGRSGCARRGALIATLGAEIEFFLRAAQLLFELLIAELQLLDLAGEHAHLVLDLVEAHHDIGGRHLRGRRGRKGAAKRDQNGGRDNTKHEDAATHIGKAALS